jgi:peptidyl-tRNA hydrolase, PTH1 family
VENSPVFLLVVGLGNPGERYAKTRHNAGFAVIDELARRTACTFDFESTWDADVARCGGRLLMKPRTFMNLSGEAVGNYVRAFRLEPARVLVVLDDASLPLGELRLRPSGGSGGHNGLESVLLHMGTSLVPRLRIGVGAPPDQIPLDEYVLSGFSSGEVPLARESFMRAADAIEHANARGIEHAMTIFNQKQNS